MTDFPTGRLAQCRLPAAIILATLILIAAACQLAATPGAPSTYTNAPPTNPTSTGQANTAGYMHPEWVSLFTTNPEVASYRWYQGDNCPGAEYSRRDDLYVFNADEVLSKLEVQSGGYADKIIGAGGFFSTDGYICVALSEQIHPSNFIALHELAHAIAYVEHGLTGHNDIFDRTLAEIALQFENSGCRTTDLRQRELIALTTFFPQGRWGRTQIKTPQEQALFNFCYPTPSTATGTSGSLPLGTYLPTLTAEQIATIPTRDPALQPIQILIPTLTPEKLAAFRRTGIMPTSPPVHTATQTPRQLADRYDVPYTDNKFLEIDYDASVIINNRQAPLTGATCIRGGRTAWSRTLDLEKHNYLIQDAKQAPAQVLRIDFTGVYPSKERSSSGCPFEYRAIVTIAALIPEQELDPTGYIAEFLTNDGHLIARTNAHDGIAISLDQYSHPEDLYDKPARLLIYDEYTPAAQPTPTPVPTILPEQKKLTFTANPQGWTTDHQSRKQLVTGYQYDTGRISPDLSDRNLQIADTKGTLWTVTSIRSREEDKYNSGQDSTTIYVSLANDTRATSDFTGYRIEITAAEESIRGGGHWDPIEDKRRIGNASISGRLIGIHSGAVTIRIWDTYEPSLAGND